MSRLALFLLLIVGSSPALAQSLASGSAPGIPWLRLIFAFGLCIALAYAAIMLLKRHQQTGLGNLLKDFLSKRGAPKPKRIAIIEARRVSPHADLCLVECDQDTFFLAVGPAGVTVLDKRSGSGMRP